MEFYVFSDQTDLYFLAVVFKFVKEFFPGFHVGLAIERKSQFFQYDFVQFFFFHFDGYFVDGRYINGFNDSFRLYVTEEGYFPFQVCH